ncbi:cupin domain-containing protein [Inhella proteolytica]|uniref:Cupin domain-containing protein n=1 Tax=Inhella proteolytica TaxID=2795029 RepID=A0A931IZI6_9BURK|nr:cupin domain-containing protein [Inhella proteolytica]MBH9576684.1 cupin domain-containing protein [Inhella proteolytica]
MRPAVLLLGLCLSLGCAAQPEPIRPEAQPWFSPPQLPGLRAAWLLGSEKGAGPYVLRVQLEAGTRIPPHTHPDTRHSTVLRGTLYVGFGGAVDEARWVAVPAGALYVAPAGVPHWLWAKDGEVEYQETGSGPTGTLPIKPS